MGGSVRNAPEGLFSGGGRLDSARLLPGAGPGQSSAFRAVTAATPPHTSGVMRNIAQLHEENNAPYEHKARFHY